MRRSKARAAVVFLACAASAGCGGSGAPDAGAPDVPAVDSAALDVPAVPDVPAADTAILDGDARPDAPADAPVDAGAAWTAMLTPREVRLSPGGTASVSVDVARVSGRDGAIAIATTGLPAGVTADMVGLAAGQGHATLVLRAAATIAQSTAAVTVDLAGVGTTASLPLRVRVVGTPGTLDQSFGTTGIYTFAPIVSDGLRLLGPVVDAEDGIVMGVGGSLVRLTRDGVPDATFGGTGSVALAAPAGRTGVGARLIRTRSGQLVVAGATYLAGGAPVTTLWRFTPAGVPDATFGTGGYATLDVDAALPDTAAAVVELSNGYLISGTIIPSAAGPTQVFVASVTLEGTLDTSYGTSGLVRFTPSADHATAYDLAVLSDGRARVASTYYDAAASAQMLTVAGLTRTAMPDGEFGTSGFQSGPGRAGRIRADGTRLLLLGQTNTLTSPMFTRLLASGMPDPAFGSTGSVRLDLGGINARVVDAAIDAMGRVTALAYVSYGTSTSGRLVRVDDHGALDATFGTAGIAGVSTGMTSDAIAGLAVQSDGSLVVTGFYITMTGNVAFVMRYSN